MITDLEIPNDVSSIGNYAFINCENVISAKIPNSVTSIGKSAFYGCTSLIDLNLENGKSKLSVKGAFQDCPIENLFYGRQVEYYNEFAALKTLKKLTIGKEVPSLYKESFNNCTSLVDLIIEDSDSILSIGENCFYNCPIERLYYGRETENTLGLSKTLRDLTIGNLVKVIGAESFSGCGGLKTLDISESVTTIGEKAFYNCSSLTNVNFGKSITTIANYAFAGCFALSYVNIPDIESWCKIDFYSQTSNSLYYAHKLYINNNLTTDLIIPNSVSSIGQFAFCNCSTLKSVTIPESVSSIGQYAFYGCSALSSITIPNSISRLETGVFEKCAGLISVIIPNSVIEIGTDVFADCAGLISISIPETVTSIGACAFKGCSALTSIIIPESVTLIAGGIFWNCSSLTSVLIGNSVTSIGGSAFGGCASLTALEIPQTVNYIGAGAFKGCSGITAFTIPDSITNIYESTFSGCSSIKTITIPNAVTSIETNAFEGCSSLKEVIFVDGEDDLSIDSYAFKKSPLESVRIGRNLKFSYNGSPFSGFNSIKEVWITDEPTSIPSKIFQKCINLANLYIGDEVTSIGEWAFSGCSSLTLFVFGEKLKEIKAEALSDCVSITDIYAKPINPPVCASQALDDLNRWTCTLHVPAISANAYSNADQWKEFFLVDNDFEVELNKQTLSAKIGETYQLSAHTKEGEKISRWVSTNEKVATVDKVGLVSIVGKGKASIAAFTERGRMDNCIIKVNLIEVTSVTLNKTSASLKVGDRFVLKATIIPEDASIKTVDWSSSDANVATVDNNGNVMALNAGTTTIKATCGDVSATCEVTVVVPAESVTLNKTSVTLKAGESETLTATVKPDNTTYKTVTWTSTKEDVATVDENGKITAVSKGAATIIATCGTVSATCAVTVEYSDATDIIVTPGSGLDDIFTKGLTIKDGESKKIDLTVVPATASPEFVWTSSNEDVVTIDKDGNITAVGVGTATVTVTSGEFSKTFTVTVDPVLAESVTLNKTSMTLNIGASETLVATVLPENTTDKTVTWSSSNTSVATVDNTGKVIAVAAGSATITATCGSVSATCEVTVVVPAESVELNKTTLELLVGASETLVATVKPDNTTDPTVTWTSSNEAVATVDSEGKVTAVAVGTATITATCGSVSATCAVTANPVLPEAVELNKTTLELLVGASETLVATVKPDNTTDPTVTWVSDDTDIATVDQNGCVTGVGVGTVLIRATCGDIVGICEVTVNPVPAESVSLNKTSLELKVGEFETLEATVLPEKTTYKTVTWTSSNENVATVNEFGRIMAVAVGTATITATCGDASATCEVTVVDESGIEALFVDKDGCEVEIYDLHGVKITTKNVIPGVYIRRVGGTIEKVLVK